MEHVKHTNLAKIVALTLSFLLVFQSISWSLPDIVSLRKDTLKTEFHFFRRMTGRGASPTAIMRTKLLGTAQLALIGEPLDSIQKMIDRGKYQAALSKLESDILPKTDGCANDGEPDNNDWIQTCEQQQLLYPLIIETIEYIESLMN